MAKRKTTAKFVEQARQKHGDLFDYSRTVYVHSQSNLEIGCKACGTWFWQIANNHLNGGKCKVCSKKKKKTTSEFITESEQEHGVGTYDYSRAVYKGARKDIELGCKTCGIWFWQLPTNHLRGHGGCPICSGSKPQSTAEFVIKAEKKHGSGIFDYSRIAYVNDKTKIEIGCKSCNSWFWQAAGGHIQGQGCPNCTTSGFKPDKPAILYYIRFDRFNEDPLYKIGITNRTVQERFTSEPLPYVILQETPYLFGFLAREAEQALLAKHAQHRYDGDALVSGNTEAFTRDVLGLDKGEIAVPA